MVTMAFCVCGYCSTCSVPRARAPSTRISRLTTDARTGRRMKMSVNCMMCSAVFRHRVGVVTRLDLVVDRHRGTVAQLHLAGGDDNVACLHAGQHRDLVAARRTGGYEGLLCGARRTVQLHQIDRAAIWVIGDRRLRQRDMLLLGADVD